MLLRTLPIIHSCDCFAMHGGTAINLFIHDLPRLSVDVDLTYIPIVPRQEALEHIQERLQFIRSRVLREIPGSMVLGPDEDGAEYKLFCRTGDVQVKIEVNTIMRGLIGEADLLPLCPSGADTFQWFCEMRIVPMSQLWGGKICAALDRQHPRDLFDVHLLMKDGNALNRYKPGLIYALLSSNRPLLVLLAPRFTDQESAFHNQFQGISRLPYSFADFEASRVQLLQALGALFTANDKRMMLSFILGTPEWTEYDYSAFPSVRWKLENLEKFRKRSPKEFRRQVALLEEALAG